MLFDSGVDRAKAKRDFKRRRGLLAENIQYLQARERSGRFGPNKLRALATAKLSLALRSCEKHGCLLLVGGLATADQAVALANEQVTDVERDRNAMFLVQRFLAISFFVPIFDVVVNQRVVVKNFDCSRGIECILERGAFVFYNFEQEPGPQPLRPLVSGYRA